MLARYADEMATLYRVSQEIGTRLVALRQSHKLSLLMRVHFRRIRGAVIGPDLSHRRTLVDDVLRADATARALAQELAQRTPSFAPQPLSASLAQP